MDFSSWHGELPQSADNLLNDSPYLAGVAPDRIESGGGVLQLSMLLQLVADAGRDVRLLIETKHPTRYGGLVETTLVEELRRFGWAGRRGPTEDLRVPADPDNRVIVMSFATTAVRRVRLLAPDIPTVKLLERWQPKRRTGRMPTGVQIAGPGLHLLEEDPGFVARAHARGHPVFVWTVNRPQDVRFLKELGVDTIITDRPAEVRALLEEH
jgi:glycerophosphoryl diester phosphodiesterase